MTIAISSARAAEIPGQLNNPFVAFDNLGQRFAAGYNSSAYYAGFPPSNMFTGSTFDYWKPNNGSNTFATIRVTFPTPLTIPFAAIAAHNAATVGASVTVQRSANGGITWVDAGAGAITPTDNSPMAWRMQTTGQDAADWRFNFYGMAPGAPLAVAVGFFGTETVIPSRIYDGYSPILTPTEMELQPNITVGGHFVRQSFISQGSTLKADFQHLDAAFMRSQWIYFQRSYNQGQPFFFGWRPQTFPADIHYCQRSGGTMRPTNAGGLDYSSVSIDARVYEAI